MIAPPHRHEAVSCFALLAAIIKEVGLIHKCGTTLLLLSSFSGLCTREKGGH